MISHVAHEEDEFAGVPPVAGLILAGGRGRRMGRRHKAFLRLAGQPLVAHVARRLRPQVRHLAISANERREDLRAFGEAVLADPVPGFAGPLAGVLAGMEWLRSAHAGMQWLLTVAVDTPFFPRDLAARLFEATRRESVDVVLAADAEREHPVFALWHVGLAADLRRALVEEDLRKARLFLDRLSVARVVFHAGGEGVAPFFNINREADLAKASALFRE